MNHMRKYANRLLFLISVLLVGVACQSTLRLPEGLADGDRVTEGITETASEAIPIAEFTPALTDLADLSELKAVFNAHPDVPRLILLLSPT